jgi:hypothetical protein
MISALIMPLLSACGRMRLGYSEGHLLTDVGPATLLESCFDSSLPASSKFTRRKRSTRNMCAATPRPDDMCYEKYRPPFDHELAAVHNSNSEFFHL